LADLDGRGVRAQEQWRARRPVEQERVLRVARRMLRREVERLEVVEVALDLRPVGDRVAHAEEDLLDPPANDRQRGQSPRARAAARQRYVDGGGAVARRGLPALDLPRELGEGRLDLGLRGVGADPEGGALGGRQRLERREELRNEPLLAAEVGALQALELGAARHTPADLL